MVEVFPTKVYGSKIHIPKKFISKYEIEDQDVLLLVANENGIKVVPKKEYMKSID